MSPQEYAHVALVGLLFSCATGCDQTCEDFVDRCEGDTLVGCFLEASKLGQAQQEDRIDCSRGCIPATEEYVAHCEPPEVDEVRLRPDCGDGDPTTPFLAPISQELRVWQIFFWKGTELDSNQNRGNYVTAPGFRFVRTSTPFVAILTSPEIPGLVTVSSIVGTSTFEYELYDPTIATLAPLTNHVFERRDRFLIKSVTQVAGRDACVDSPKTFVSQTIDVCLVDLLGSSQGESTQSTEGVGGAALAAGTCIINVTHEASGRTQSIEFPVAPWDVTCETESGTCGAMCAEVECFTPVSCLEVGPDQGQCEYVVDPDNQSSACTDANSEYQEIASEFLCW